MDDAHLLWPKVLDHAVNPIMERNKFTAHSSPKTRRCTDSVADSLDYSDFLKTHFIIKMFNAGFQCVCQMIRAGQALFS